MLRQTKYLYAKNINKIENGLLWTRVTLASVTFSKDKVVEYRLQRHKACSTPHNLLLCAVCFWVRISSNPNLNVWCAFTFSDIFRVVFVLCGCTYLCVCMCGCSCIPTVSAYCSYPNPKTKAALLVVSSTYFTYELDYTFSLCLMIQAGS